MSSESHLSTPASNSSPVKIESSFEADTKSYQTKGQYSTLIPSGNLDVIEDEEVVSRNLMPNGFAPASVQHVSNMQKLERWMFCHLFKITLAAQTFVLLVIRWCHPKAFAFERSRNVNIEAFCWFSEIALAACNTIANIHAARSIMNAYVSLSSLIQLYISNTIVFAGLYFACFLVDQFSFRLQTDFSDHGPSATFVIFWYFSFATQSTSGFGDIIPRRFVSQVLTSMQMLISVLYSVAIFAVGTTHIRIQHELNAKEPVRRVESQFDIESITERFSNQLERYIPWYHPLSVLIRKAPLLLTCLTMFLCLLIVIVFRVDFSDILQPSAKLVLTALFVLMLQCANFIVVITTSFILVRKINAEDVTPQFLIQSYLSTALLFGGMYFTIYVIEGPSSFHLVPSDLQGKNIAQLIFHFGYFAISAQTGCGFGDIYPLSISTRLVVSFHFLVSMIYTAIILGLGLSNLVDRIIPGRLLASVKNESCAETQLARPIPLSE